MSFFKPSARYQRTSSGHIVALAPANTPTVDFYVRSRCELIQGVTITYCFGDDLAQLAECIRPGVFVIVVRHASRKALQYVLRNSAQLSGAAFLVDDDLPNAWRCNDVPVDYGFWTSTRYYSIAKILQQLCDQIWFSTPALLNKNQGERAKLVPPLPTEDHLSQAMALDCRVWTYPGSRVHINEMRWVLNLVEQVHKRNDSLVFEIFADGRIAKRFQSLERVRIVSPMTWLSFKEHCIASKAAVVINPLLPGRFNSMRSHTKLFDSLLLGAILMTSDDSPYAPVLCDSGALLQSTDQKVWVNAILNMFEDDMCRVSRYEKMKIWAQEQKERARLTENLFC